MKRQVKRRRTKPSANTSSVRSLLIVAVGAVLTYLIYTALIRYQTPDNNELTLTRQLATFGGALLVAALLCVIAAVSDLLLGLVVLPIIGALLLNEQDAWLGVGGALLWALGATLAAFAGLAYYAQFILPLRGTRGNTQAMNLLVRYGLRSLAPLPKHAVTDSLSESSFETLGVGFVPSHEVLALTKDVGFTRGGGPGFLRLNRKESIKGTVDLRRHHRTVDLQATTRDGIEVETSLLVAFQLRQQEWHPDPRVPFPFDERSVFDVFYARTVAQDAVELAWSERVAPQAKHSLVEALSRRTLDSLYRVNEPEATPIADVCDVVLHDLQREFERQGIDILHIELDQITVPPSIMEQRIKRWRKEWDNRIRIIDHQRMGQSVGRMDEEVARIHMEVIEELEDNIEMLRQSSNRPINHQIADRMRSLLAEAATEGVIRTLIPPPKVKQEEKKEEKEEKKEAGQSDSGDTKQANGEGQANG